MSKTARAPKTLREHREALGLSLAQAAAQIGLARVVLERCEAGGRGVTVATLERVGDFYGLTLTQVAACCEAARAAGGRAVADGGRS